MWHRLCARSLSNVVGSNGTVPSTRKRNGIFRGRPSGISRHPHPLHWALSKKSITFVVHPKSPRKTISRETSRECGPISGKSTISTPSHTSSRCSIPSLSPDSNLHPRSNPKRVKPSQTDTALNGVYPMNPNEDRLFPEHSNPQNRQIALIRNTTKYPNHRPQRRHIRRQCGSRNQLRDEGVRISLYFVTSRPLITRNR